MQKYLMCNDGLLRRSSGYICIDGDQTYMIDNLGEPVLIAAAKKIKIDPAPPIRFYDWSPWVKIETDHKDYMIIESLDHIDNCYPVGRKWERYDQVIFNRWKHIFTGELTPVALPTIAEIMEDKNAQI